MKTVVLRTTVLRTNVLRTNVPGTLFIATLLLISALLLLCAGALQYGYLISDYVGLREKAERRERALFSLRDYALDALAHDRKKIKERLNDERELTCVLFPWPPWQSKEVYEGHIMLVRTKRGVELTVCLQTAWWQTVRLQEVATAKTSGSLSCILSPHFFKTPDNED